MTPSNVLPLHLRPIAAPRRSAGADRARWRKHHGNPSCREPSRVPFQASMSALVTLQALPLRHTKDAASIQNARRGLFGFRSGRMLSPAQFLAPIRSDRSRIRAGQGASILEKVARAFGGWHREVAGTAGNSEHCTSPRCGRGFFDVLRRSGHCLVSGRASSHYTSDFRYGFQTGTPSRDFGHPELCRGTPLRALVVLVRSARR